jgi:uncharacterized protein YehS (DUF1456 family)
VPVLHRLHWRSAPIGIAGFGENAGAKMQHLASIAKGIIADNSGTDGRSTYIKAENELHKILLSINKLIVAFIMKACQILKVAKREAIAFRK